MDGLFCAESSRQSGIDIVGSASDHDIYIAIECPLPWTPYDLDSELIPANLRKLAEKVSDNYERYKARFLLIYSEQLKSENCTRVLIFHKPPGLVKDYDRWEFRLADIGEVAPLVENYLMDTSIKPESGKILTRDILICTHGSRDRCCARFGNGLYRQALKIVSDLQLNQVRIWQASHIGGHRFAPTAIDFPEGRYYGYLDGDSLAAILTHTGDIACLKPIYRGCGTLPWSAQVVEKELLLKQGWDWFNYPMSAKVLECNEGETYNRVELTYETPNGERYIYRADVVADETKKVYLKGSCNSEKASEVMPYEVKNLTQVENCDGDRRK